MRNARTTKTSLNIFLQKLFGSQGFRVGLGLGNRSPGLVLVLVKEPSSRSRGFIRSHKRVRFAPIF